MHLVLIVYGTLGCVSASLIGTIDSWPTFIVNDGPWFGIGSVSAPSFCISNNSLFSATHKTYNTDD